MYVMQGVVKACGGNYYSPSTTTCADLLSKVDEANIISISFSYLTCNICCLQYLVISSYLQEVDGLNIYDILEPCYHDPHTNSFSKAPLRFPSSFRKLGETERPLPVRNRMFGRAWPYRAPVRQGFVPSWPQLSNSDSGVPCIVTRLFFLLLFPISSCHSYTTETCIALQDDMVATSWLNNAQVRKALHATDVQFLTFVGS